MIDLLAKIISGATTGYITNNLALKMLFRKYGPFGGVILETKTEFIENISKLIEEDLINHNTVNNELKKDEFKTSFKIFIKDILNEFIYKNMKGIYIKEIPGYKKTRRNFQKFSECNFEKYLQEYIEVTGKYIHINEIISNKQLFNLSKKSLSIFTDSVENNQVLNNLIFELYDKHCTKHLSNYFPEDIVHKLIDNFTDSQNSAFAFEQNLFEKQSINLNLKLLIENLLDNINNKTFLELITKMSTEKENEIYRLQQRGKFLIKSKENEEIIKNISITIIDILKNIDLTISEILNDDFQNKLLSLMKNKLPALIEIFTEYLHDNQKPFEKLIEKAIEEELAKKSGLKNYIKQIIYDSFKQQISKKQIFAKGLINYFKSGQNVETVSKDITNHFIYFLEEISIGKIIMFLEKNEIINPEILSKIIKKYFTNLNSDQIYELFNSKIDDLLNLEVDSIFQVINTILKKNFLSLKKLNPIINYLLKENLSELNNKQIEDIVSKEQLQKYNYSRITCDTIKKNNKFLAKKLFNLTSDFIKYKKVNDIVPPEIIIDYLHEDLSLYLNNKIKQQENKKFSTIYNRFNKNQQIIKIDRLYEFLLNIIDKNLNSILEGNIKKIIATNLNKLSDQEVQNSIENFMGKELKPIMLLGALLGSIGGFSLYTLPQLFPGFSLFTYGFVGYITNVIALKMIFLPYQEKRIANIKLPFTPGIVTKNKSRLAHSMGNFINEDLLDPVIINEILSNNRNKIKESLFDYLHEENNKIKSLIKNNNSLVTRNLINTIRIKIKENQNKIIDEITDNLSDEKIASFSISTQDINFNLNKDIKRKVYNHSQSLFRFLQNTDKEVKDLLPETFKKQMFDLMFKIIFENIFDKTEILINKEKFILFMNSHYDKGVEELFNFSPESILNKEQKEIFKNMIKYHTRKINSILNLNLITETFLKTDKIYSKKLKNYLNYNVKDIVELFLNKIYKFLDNNRSTIKNKVLRIINETLIDKKSKGEFFNQLKYFGIESTFRFIDLDDTIESVIDNLINKKIPDYLDNNKNELISKVRILINNTSPKDLQDFVFLLNENIVSDNLNKEIINKKKFNQLIDYLVGEFLNLKFNIISRLLGIRSFADLFEMFKDELEILYKFLNNNKVSIRKELKLIIKELYEKLFLKQKVSSLFSGINNDDWHKFEKNLESLIKDSETELKYFFKKLVNNFLSELEQKSTEEMLDLELLKKSINEKMDRLLQNKQFINDICQISESLISEFSSEIDNIIDKDTEKYFFNLILNSILDSLEKNFYDIFKAIDIEKVTETEVNKMDAEEIETMFYSFADKYFKRLKLYGWMGSGIGGLVELLISLIK